jgi:hypothetical protein
METLTVRGKSKIGMLIGFWIAAVLAVTQLPAQQKSTPGGKKESTAEWICRLLHLDPKVYAKLVGVRQGQEQLGGDHLALANLDTKTETQVEACGECWSPAVIDSQTIAFLKSDGIWIKPVTGGESKRAVSATGLRMLAGPVAGSASALIVLQHLTGEAECEYRLVVADLSAGGLDLKSQAPQCLGEEDIGAVPRAGAIHGTRVLYNSHPGQGFRRILVGEMTNAPESGGDRVSLLPWVESNADGIDRFDAVWLDNNRVIYVQKQ